MMQDTNIVAVELAAQSLGPLMDELVLVGGCAVGLLVTDKARPPVRETIDVDLLTEVTPLANYYAFSERLVERGFKQRPTENVICRWFKGDQIIDVMPTDPEVLGFTNRWYESALNDAVLCLLPSGRQVRVITAPHFLATKLVAFASRGNGDYVHHDIEDIVNIIDGRESIVEEVLATEPLLRQFLMEEFDDLLADSIFVERISYHLGSHEHIFRKEIVLSRMRKIAGL